MTRVAREAYVLICGKYPHPQTIVPGGMSSTITLTVMNEMFTRLAQFFDYSKKLAAIWDDLTEFFYEANPAYKQVGARRANLIDSGIFDHHEPTTPPMPAPPRGASGAGRLPVSSWMDSS